MSNKHQLEIDALKSGYQLLTPQELADLIYVALTDPTYSPHNQERWARERARNIAASLTMTVVTGA